MKLTIQDALRKDKSQYPHALLRSSPPSYAFSSSSDHRCLPGFLFCALEVRLNICHCLKANLFQVSILLNISFLLFPHTDLCFSFFSQPSLCAWNINAPVWLSWGRSCAHTLLLLLRVLLRLPAIQRGCWGGEAQVWMMLSQSPDPGI